MNAADLAYDPTRKMSLAMPLSFGADAGVTVTNLATLARGNYKLAEWWAEAERERGNAGADVAVVVFKRKGVGLARTGEQFVITTLHDFLEMVR